MAKKSDETFTFYKKAKKTDETFNFYKKLEKMELEGRLKGTDNAVVAVLMDIGVSLARITDALEKLSEEKE